ncbi:MAG: LPS export ABC transporter periplasmic protein LptC [Candidatus Berkiella sp.]
MFKFHIHSPYRILVFACLGLAVILLFVFLSPSPVSPHQPNVENIAIVEEAMKGISAHRFDKNGKLIQVVEMDSWQHHKGQTITQMVAPRLIIHQDNGNSLTVFGIRGEGYQSKMGAQIDKLKLTEEVSVKQVNPKTDSFWELKTHSLLFFPKEPNPSAETDDKVTVYAPGLTIEGQGMRADLNRETVELLNQVKTFYATPQA